MEQEPKTDLSQDEQDRQERIRNHDLTMKVIEQERVGVKEDTDLMIEMLTKGGKQSDSEEVLGVQARLLERYKRIEELARQLL